MMNRRETRVRITLLYTHGHFHVVDQSKPVLPREAGVARGRRLADVDIFAQIVNGRREQLDGVVNEGRLHLYERGGYKS